MVAPELPVSELVKRIAQTGHRKFLVVSDHHLNGVITLADLTGFLNQNGFRGDWQKATSKH
ncbi:CBS domain-containing protein [Sulfitobacter sp. SK012]|uniref:CBS domain-containing protein n=1 Tax=Sulfitobacter sp. SK012 TaxID=1389005 RepID=UPI0020C770C8|nr:CBS domain-containing protein [Sulfitobacter sp. SK012]